MNTVEASLSQEQVSAWQESAGRILVTGWPRAGKTTLCARLEARGIVVQHTDDLAGVLEWSEASAEVALWMAEPGPWCIEGTAGVRACRKRMAAHPGRPCDLLVWMRRPHVELTPGQVGMGRGAETILAGIRPELVRRGVEILEP